MQHTEPLHSSGKGPDRRTWGIAKLLLKDIAFMQASVAHWKGLTLPKLSFKFYVEVEHGRNGSGVAKAFARAPMEQRPSSCRE